MGTKVEVVAEEYLYSINPLARRIGADVASTKEAYEGLWSTLTLNEQKQAIDETIIQPEVALKYAVKKQEREVPECYPKLRIQTGMKYVIDETGSTLRWKDEHSAPFSFMTQSQMSLNIFDDTNDTRSQTYCGQNYLTESGYDSSNQLSFYQSDSGSVFLKGECVLPKVDDVVDESLLDTDSYNSSQSQTKETDIPKTGFEFLDNW